MKTLSMRSKRRKWGQGNQLLIIPYKWEALLERWKRTTSGCTQNFNKSPLRGIKRRRRKIRKKRNTNADNIHPILKESRKNRKKEKEKDHHLLPLLHHHLNRVIEKDHGRRSPAKPSFMKTICGINLEGCLRRMNKEIWCQITACTRKNIRLSFN